MDISLADLNSADAFFDRFKGYSEQVINLYQPTFPQYAQRISHCAPVLLFKSSVDSETGEIKIKLESARFCRVRFCPMCQWRSQRMYLARFKNGIVKYLSDHSGVRFLLLTLTLRNCEIDNLRETIQFMNSGWKRLAQLSEFPAMGWVKTLEVTAVYDCYFGSQYLARRGMTWVKKWEKEHGVKLRLVLTTEVHPHFHCLLMVDKSYFSGRNYLSQKKWSELWQQSLRVDYNPMVHVTAVKGETYDQIYGAVSEVIKYSVKPSDLTSDEAWLAELTRQMYKMRRIAVGGNFKIYMKDEEPEDLIHDNCDSIDESEDISSGQFVANWDSNDRKYLGRFL